MKALYLNKLCSEYGCRLAPSQQGKGRMFHLEKPCLQGSDHSFLDPLQVGSQGGSSDIRYHRCRFLRHRARNRFGRRSVLRRQNIRGTGLPLENKLSRDLLQIEGLRN